MTDATTPTDAEPTPTDAEPTTTTEPTPTTEPIAPVVAPEPQQPTVSDSAAPKGYDQSTGAFVV